ncbi:hypothetical protein ADK60_05295 [Streptomyces sp. XY431]|uniref:hypothetical protein n=1 Tax=Streptomyces sp. XY431 TaxID=1415562 RepID=UPI0006AE7274|nr:hypothetical protein [Streptomyces sp. XY431]KOV37120.1 hypothetical protein ADK60_05295 [Streptomyces sp. XY431]
MVAHPSGETLPRQGSHVSYGPGRTVADQVVVPVGADGRPGTSSLDFKAGQTVANAVAAQLGGNPGSVDVYHHAAGSTQVIADLTGWFVEG